MVCLQLPSDAHQYSGNAIVKLSPRALRPEKRELMKSARQLERNSTRPSVVTFRQNFPLIRRRVFRARIKETTTLLATTTIVSVGHSIAYDGPSRILIRPLTTSGRTPIHSPTLCSV